MLMVWVCVVKGMKVVQFSKYMIFIGLFGIGKIMIVWVVVNILVGLGVIVEFKFVEMLCKDFVVEYEG